MNIYRATPVVLAKNLKQSPKTFVSLVLLLLRLRVNIPIIFSQLLETMITISTSYVPIYSLDAILHYFFFVFNMTNHSRNVLYMCNRMIIKKKWQRER